MDELLMENVEYRTTGYRWVILIFFAGIVFNNAMLLVGFSAIAS